MTAPLVNRMLALTSWVKYIIDVCLSAELTNLNFQQLHVWSNYFHMQKHDDAMVSWAR